MMRFVHAVPDSSLISDISDAEGNANETERLDGGECSNGLVDGKHTSSQPAISSPRISDTSSHSSKQVRFQCEVSFSSMDRLNENVSPSVGGFTHTTDCPIDVRNEETEDLTSITVLHDSSITKDSSSISRLKTTYNPKLPATLTSDKPCGPQACELSHSTSLWLETCDTNSDTSCETVTKEDYLCGNYLDKGPSFFRTSDHLPRPPLSHSSQSIICSQKSSTFKAAPDDIPIPRKFPRDLSPSSDCLSISIVGECDTAHSFTSTSSGYQLSEPKLNSAKILVEQLNRLAEKLDRTSCSGPSEQARQEAARLMRAAFDSHNTHNDARELVLNPGLTVNIPEQLCTFNNLMELSVNESEIVRQERERIAKQRKRMNQLRKQAKRDRPHHPPPDLLEFFDPNRHIFQSINLHFRGLPSFLPSLTRASDNLVTLFHDRRMMEFRRLSS
ncbi:uncharacterized protein DEA37_0002019 [Paragonimus westermani]|uniref:Uncharacterized protein n=1 Tax=Paragonimus westermani TaxID=34504 RepID=A0A5J4P2V6_9TREM|nr:uncharacterized protein DEA37_0002019 [Paragonimus westermani]